MSPAVRALIFSFLLFGGSAYAKWGASLRCFYVLADIHRGDFTRLHEKKAELEALLKGRDAKGEDLINVFRSVYEIRQLFAKDAGVREGYTLIKHTGMVYDTYNEQIPHHDLGDIKLPGGGSPYRLLKATIALHDLGKPPAIENKEPKAQHEYTVVIMERTLKEAGFSDADIKVMVTLVDNGLVGAIVRGRLTPDQAVEENQRLAALAGISPRDYFRLQEVFFISDAASYPLVRASAFDQAQNGRLEFKDKNLRDVRARIVGPGLSR